MKTSTLTQKEMVNGEVDAKPVWLCSFAVSIAALFWFLSYGLQPDKSEWTGVWAWVRKSNLTFYLTALLIFFAVFLISRRLFSRCFAKPFPVLQKRYSLALENIAASIIAIGVLVLFLNYAVIQQFFEAHNHAHLLPIARVPAGYIIVLLTAGATLVVWTIREKRDLSSNWLSFIYILCIALAFCSLYYPNIFIADFHHGIATVESIFNVADLTPYTYETIGIYGHYALFFLLPLKLLGCSIETVVGLMAFAGCITYMSVLYVVHHLLPQNWMRGMAAFASIYNVAVFYASNYWAVEPIRIVFPAVFMAYAVYLCKHKATRWWWKTGLGWLLGALAVLWNTESGIFCLLAFAAFLLTELWQKYKWYEKKMLFAYGLSVMFCVSAILGSVVILNIYNLLCGGPLVFRTFFFPLLSQQYVDGLQIGLVWGNHAWIYVLILFFLSLCWGLYHTRWFGLKRTYCEMAPAAVLIAVLGLLSFSYYANRAAYGNLSICFTMVICANALLIGVFWPQVFEKSTASFYRSCKKAVTIVCMTVVFCLSIQILYVPVRMKERHEAGPQSTISLRAEAEALRKAIPENTYGIGAGVSIIYHILGWDNYGHFRDTSDLSVGGTADLDAMVESVLRHDSFLYGVRNSMGIIDSILAEDWHYQYEKSVVIQGSEYQYYVRHPYACGAAVSEDNAAIHFSFRDDSAHTSLRAAVWSEEGGQDDLRWFPADYVDHGIWEGDADLRGFDKTGNYIVQFYAADGGESYLIAETSAAVAALPIDQGIEE